MRYVLYGRKSSESEDRQIQSIDDQLRVLRELSQSLGLEVVEEITESKSAKAPGNRPGFETMLRLIERGNAEAILCWSVNRLTRNPIDSGKLAWMLQTGKLHAIQTPDKQYLPTDNVLIFSVETGTANQYILDLKKAVARGTQTKVAKGWSPHRAPAGYFNNTYNHTIEADGERFTLLQRAWRLLLAGTHTPSQAIAVLNEEWGYRMRPTYSRRADAFLGGGKLSRSAGYRLFSNIFYAGYFQHEGQVYRGNHPAMVTLSEFEEVQRRLRGQTGRAHRHKHSFAYAGLITCARCGRTVTPERQRGEFKSGHYIYYHCSNTAVGCTKRGVREEVIEARIEACLASITISPELREIVIRALDKWLENEHGGLDTVYERQNRAIIEAETMLSQLVEMRLRNLVDDAIFLAKQRELRQRVSTLRIEMGKTQERLERTRQAVREALAFRQTARAQYLTGDANRRREIASALGLRYLFKDKDIVIEMNPLLACMASKIVAKNDQFELPKVGSGRTKKALSFERVSFGGLSRTEFESLSNLFRSVWDGEISFHAPSRIQGMTNIRDKEDNNGQYNKSR